MLQFVNKNNTFKDYSDIVIRVIKKKHDLSIINNNYNNKKSRIYSMSKLLNIYARLFLHTCLLCLCCIGKQYFAAGYGIH